MPFDTDQFVKVAKLVLFVVFTIVSAAWTYTVYYENERKSELETLVSLGNSIAGMHVTCKGSFDELAELAGKERFSREGRCYSFFQDAHRISLAAVITIKKPYSVSAKDWAASWDNLQNVIATAGSQAYDFSSLEDAWSTILISKGLKDSPVDE